MNNPLSRTGSSPSQWLRQRKPRWFAKDTPTPTTDPLRTAGQLLREARESKGLGLRELAQRTRISIAVLEALEGGWKDRLPEATYLRAMLPLLEHQLELPAGTLERLLPQGGQRAGGTIGQAGGPQAPAFSPSTLHLLTSWQSAFLYSLLVLGLLYGVNLQQQRLAATGRLAAKPIPLTPSNANKQDNHGVDFPGLRPLQMAAAGQAMGLLTKETKQGGPDLSLGLLTLNLKQPTQVELQSRSSGDTQLEGLSGELSLPVLPPFALRLTPAPPAASVRWRGQTLREKSPDSSEAPSSPDGATAIFQVPVPAPTKPAPAAPTPP